MKPAILKRLTDERLAMIANGFGLSISELVFVGGFENRVYTFSKGGRDFILRIGHSARRPEDQVRSELELLEYLHRGGVSVAVPRSPIDAPNFVRVDDGDGEAFLATSFHKAKGKRLEKENWTSSFFHDYGRIIGRLHHLGSHFQPSSSFYRPTWDDKHHFAELHSYLPSEENAVAEKIEQIRSQIQQLPSDPARFGMIHQDAHTGNLFVDENGQITLFDFDDCVHGHFAYDIAMVFFYAGISDPDPNQAITKFIDPFLSGYREEFSLPADCLQTIPLFMKLREIDLYAIIRRSFDVATTDNEWMLRFLGDGERRHRIENDVPWTDFDWQSV